MGGSWDLMELSRFSVFHFRSSKAASTQHKRRLLNYDSFATALIFKHSSKHFSCQAARWMGWPGITQSRGGVRASCEADWPSASRSAPVSATLQAPCPAAQEAQALHPAQPPYPAPCNCFMNYAKTAENKRKRLGAWSQRCGTTTHEFHANL